MESLPQSSSSSSKHWEVNLRIKPRCENEIINIQEKNIGKKFKAVKGNHLILDERNKDVIYKFPTHIINDD